MRQERGHNDRVCNREGIEFRLDCGRFECRKMEGIAWQIEGGAAGPGNKSLVRFPCTSPEVKDKESGRIDRDGAELGSQSEETTATPFRASTSQVAATARPFMTLSSCLLSRWVACLCWGRRKARRIRQAGDETAASFIKVQESTLADPEGGKSNMNAFGGGYEPWEDGSRLARVVLSQRITSGRDDWDRARRCAMSRASRLFGPMVADQSEEATQLPRKYTSGMADELWPSDCKIGRGLEVCTYSVLW